MSAQGPLLDEAQPQFERVLIRAALKRTQGHRQEAAKLLGWGRNTLTRKLKELGIVGHGPRSHPKRLPQTGGLLIIAPLLITAEQCPMPNWQ